jgi:hypothetical protein
MFVLPLCDSLEGQILPVHDAIRKNVLFGSENLDLG